MLGIVCEGICETCISVSISAELGSKWGAFGDFFARRPLKPTNRGGPAYTLCIFGFNGNFGAQGGNPGLHLHILATIGNLGPEGGGQK